ELENLHNQLILENTKKVDIIAPLAKAEFVAEDDKNYLIIQEGRVLPSEYHDYGLSDLRDRIFELNSHSLQQLCSKIGVPMSYAGKCEAGVREFNIRHWLEKADGNSMFRCMVDGRDSRLRGIMSERYSPVDDSFIVDNLNRAIENSNLSNPLVTKTYTGEDMLRLQVTDGKKAVVGDTTLGFFVGNSEVGLSRIYIEMGLYTFTCTNGLRVPAFSMEFNRKHIGNISYNMISDNFQTQIGNIMNNFNHMRGYMRIANQITMKRHVFNKYIEESKNFSLSFKDSMKSRIHQLPAQGVLWNYVSEMTEEAHKYKELERMEIEKQAGLYMEQVVKKEVKKGRYELATV
ncbi:MAG: DUF932 domain-containing protein, partial [Nitrospirota bacterium]